MRVNNKFDSTVRRNLQCKNVRFPSLLGLTMGVFMLMALGAPSAHATFLLTYFNFEDGNLTADPPGQQLTPTIFNDTTNPYPTGQFGVTAGVGTTDNTPPGNVQTTNSALDLQGNANITAGSNYCLDLGPVNTLGKTGISLSFALASIGNGGQFDVITAAWGTNGTTYGNTITLALDSSLIGKNTMNNPPVYQVVTGDLTGADNLSSVFIQFCFSAKGNAANGNHTYLDNIQVTAAAPEPSTYISGLLGVVGLCWYQRRRVACFLRLRRV